ncbi:MAG: DNA-3-methyladenine glycosylase 2 family protein [Clostridia bacterium]|nr:DNA-3-methyladenine glycosylase 2 family protein [Clostridia bacterium]
MKTVIISDKDFDLRHTFDCGQCFRWEEENGSFIGVAGGKWAKFEKIDEGVLLTTDSDDITFWREYLDLERDYSEIKNAVSINPLMTQAVSYGGGIRILKQDFFETLLSFIISQRSSIPKIKSSVKKLCEKYGKEIVIDDKVYYTFPTAEDLKNVTEADYRELGVGYRAPYLASCVQDVLQGRVSYDELVSLDTPKAREKLMSVRGVGDKVCDCVMLFALGKFDLFPSDVWIKRVMCENFGSSEKSAKEDGEKLFGKYSGFAQQYLFYYRRSIG